MPGSPSSPHGPPPASCVRADLCVRPHRARGHIVRTNFLVNNEPPILEGFFRQRPGTFGLAGRGARVVAVPVRPCFVAHRSHCEHGGDSRAIRPGPSVVDEIPPITGCSPEIVASLCQSPEQGHLSCAPSLGDRPACGPNSSGGSTPFRDMRTWLFRAFLTWTPSGSHCPWSTNDAQCYRFETVRSSATALRLCRTFCQNRDQAAASRGMHHRVVDLG